MSEDSANTLLRLERSDRARLGEALRVLLDHGSILGGEGPQADLYHWAYANRPWLAEMCDLFELDLFWEHESRLVQAVPRTGEFLLRLRLDATLVLLTLWYIFDSAVRDQGETPPIHLTAEQLRAELETKFQPLKNAMLSHSRLIEILRLGQKKNLLRFTPSPDPPKTRIQILSTIKRVLPFQDLAEWTRHADRFLTPESAPDSADEDPEN